MIVVRALQRRLPPSKVTPTEGKQMNRVRVLVGTRKGAFVIEADGKRERWKIAGPHFAGWEIYHLKGSPLEKRK
jgi:hypothetical protein